MSVWYQLTTRGGGAHLEDHQMSGLYVSLVPSDHQMLGQPSYRTTR